MADTKVTALTELTAVEATDLLYVVDDPSGSPVSKKATVESVRAAIPGFPHYAKMSTDIHPTCKFYYLPLSASGWVSTMGAAAAQMPLWYPFMLDRRMVVAGIHTYCWTGEADSYLRVGLYNCDDRWRPTTLIADYGTMSGASTGLKNAAGTTVVPAGMFSLCVWSSNHTSVRWSKISAIDPRGAFGEREPAFNAGQMCYRLQTETADYSAGLPATMVGTAVYGLGVGNYPICYLTFGDPA